MYVCRYVFLTFYACTDSTISPPPSPCSSSELLAIPTSGMEKCPRERQDVHPIRSSRKYEVIDQQEDAEVDFCKFLITTTTSNHFEDVNESTSVIASNEERFTIATIFDSSLRKLIAIRLSRMTLPRGAKWYCQFEWDHCRYYYRWNVFL